MSLNAKINVALGGVLIAIVIAIIAASGQPSADQNAGANGSRFPDGLSVGSTSPSRYKLLVGASGTNIGTIVYGTCFLRADNSIAASSTGMADCVSSSFLVGDTVIIGGLATSTVEMAKQIDILGTGSASSTAGFAPVRVFNWSGTALTPSSKQGLGSSTPFVIIRP